MRAVPLVVLLMLSCAPRGEAQEQACPEPPVHAAFSAQSDEELLARWHALRASGDPSVATWMGEYHHLQEVLGHRLARQQLPVDRVIELLGEPDRRSPQEVTEDGQVVMGSLEYVWPGRPPDALQLGYLNGHLVRYDLFVLMRR